MILNTLSAGQSGKTTPWMVRAGVCLLAAVTVLSSGDVTRATAVGKSRPRIYEGPIARVFDASMLGAPQPAQGRRSAQGQAEPQVPPQPRVPMVSDFSSRQVVFPEVVPTGRVAAIRADARAWQQYLRRHARRPEAPPADDGAVEPVAAAEAVVRDWSYSLNGGSGGTISAPAKYVFDVNAPPSCTNDFVVTGINVAGAAARRI